MGIPKSGSFGWFLCVSATSFFCLEAGGGEGASVHSFPPAKSLAASLQENS